MSSWDGRSHSPIDQFGSTRTLSKVNMSHSCTICGKGVRMPYNCSYCGIQTCSTHRLPESHFCIGLKHQEDGKWFNESLSPQRRRSVLMIGQSTNRSRSRPKTLDPEEITARRTPAQRQSKTKHYGPDTAPDGSLVYDEPEHSVTVEEIDEEVSNVRWVVVALFIIGVFTLVIFTF